ncbi:hypothetical protein CHUAL_011919 [Chamberlinius hualienensis]
MKFTLALLLIFGLAVAVFADEHENDENTSEETDEPGQDNPEDGENVAEDVAAIVGRHRRCAGSRSTTTVAA